MDSGTAGASDSANGTNSPSPPGRLAPMSRRSRSTTSTESDFALLDAQRPAFTAERQAEQILRIMRGMADDPSFGYRINTFRHCLQSATMAHRAGKDEDYVAMAFLHDIGFDIAPVTHGGFVAALVGPYVSAEMEWLLVNHADFQNMHCRNHPSIEPLRARQVARAPGVRDDRRVLREVRPGRDGPGLRQHADGGVRADGPAPVRQAAARGRLTAR